MKYFRFILLIFVLNPCFFAQDEIMEELGKHFTGKWTRNIQDGSIAENWTFENGILTGTADKFTREMTIIKNVENLMITVLGKNIYYIAHPSENKYPIAFELTERHKGKFRFENTEHDFPTFITYHFSGDSLNVSIGNKEKDFIFVYTKSANIEKKMDD